MLASWPLPNTVSAITTKNFMVGQVEMLCNFGRTLGIIFFLSGIAVVILARDRLSLGKAAHRMASYTHKHEENLGGNLGVIP